MCFVRGSGRRSRRQRRMRNVKESRRVTGLQGVVRKNIPAPGPVWDRRKARWASLMVGNNCTSLNSRSIRDDATLASDYPVRGPGILRRRPGTFHQCSPGRDLETLDPIQPSSCAVLIAKSPHSHLTPHAKAMAASSKEWLEPKWPRSSAPQRHASDNDHSSSHLSATQRSELLQKERVQWAHMAAIERLSR